MNIIFSFCSQSSLPSLDDNEVLKSATNLIFSLQSGLTREREYTQPVHPADTLPAPISLSDLEPQLLTNLRIYRILSLSRTLRD